MKRILIALALTSLMAGSVWATDGYLSHGYGVKQSGMGGAGVAFPVDSLAGASNPAGMVVIGSRFDFGVNLFDPTRSGSIEGNQLPPGYPNVNGSYGANGQQYFLIPELGYNRMLRPNLSFGVSIYGNGGMNTSYTQPIFLLGSSPAGIDLQQLFIAPTVAMKVTPRNAVGISLNIAYQRFSAVGLQNFASPLYSSDPARVTNRGYDSSEGVGLRLGWIGQVNRIISLGATYQSPTWMGKFNQYRGLFAGQGGFNIPANFAGGVAIKANRRTTVALDVERILYGEVKSIANLDSNQALLGSENGPGFGWHDVTAPKVGVQYVVNSKLTLRGGYNHSGLPFDQTQTFFNLLAPGVVQSHITGGVTWNLPRGREISFAYMHAFDRAVNGLNSIPPNAGGGNASLRMREDSVGVSFGWSRE